MQKVAPFDQLGVVPIPDWVNASPSAGIKGSIFNVTAVNALMAEVVNTITAAGLTPDANDYTQLAAAIRALIAAGAVDPVTINNIANTFIENNTFTRYSSANLVGLSLAQTGDYAIPRGVLTTVPLSPITVNLGFGSVSNGVLTLVEGGFYNLSLAGSMYLSTNHAADAATLRFNISAGSGGNPLGAPYASPPGGGQASASFYTSFIAKLNSGDQVKLQAMGNNSFNDAVNVGVSGYTNLTVALLNS